MSKILQSHRDLGQMSDRDLEDYIQLHQLDLDPAEIHPAQKEYSRRWWRSLLREQWPVLLLGLLIVFSLLLWVASDIQDWIAPSPIYRSAPPVPLVP